MAADNELLPLSQIVENLRGNPQTPTFQKMALPSIKKDTGKIQAITYDVPTNAIYDRLNDGRYIARFENYAGAVGNEDRLAKEQSWYEQAGYGLVKNARKMGNYFLDATVGTVSGIYNAVSTGTLEGFYDNDFSSMIDDWNKQLDYKLPNYYTDEQKSQGFLESLGTSNFWFNDVAGGLAFVGGALLPEIAIGTLTGGTSLPASFSKFGLKYGFKKAGKEVLEEALDPTNYRKGQNVFNSLNNFKDFDKGVDLVKNFQRANYMKTAGNIMNTSLFLARTSGFEAGMEARNNYRSAMDEYFQTFEEKNGRQPTFEEVQSFSDQARKASNSVFAANMAILAVSNATMFGKAFNIKLLPDISRKFQNKIMGLGIDKLDDFTLAAQKTSKIRNIGASTYKILSKPVVEGVYEEGLQGVAGQTMQNYLRAQYDPKQEDSFGLWASLSDAFAHQYGTAEGWKEMGIGMLIGFLGGPITGEGFEGFGKNSRRAAAERFDQDIEAANKGIQVFRDANRANSMRTFRNTMETKEAEGKSFSAENDMLNAQYIRSQQNVRTYSQMKQDHDTIIDHMQLDEQSLAALGVENLDSYKQQLKDNFDKSLKDYQFAQNTVESLGIQDKVELAPGDVVELKDALAMNIYMGKRALDSAKGVAQQIQAITGQSGVFDFMEFYNGLSQEKKATVRDLRKKTKRLEQLREKAVEYGQRTAGIQMENRRNFKQPTLEKRFQTNAEKLVLTQNQITQLEQEVQNMQKALSPDVQAIAKGLTDKTLEGSIFDIQGALTQLDQIDTYKQALRDAGKTYEADSLDYLVNQFKVYSDAHREMTNTARRMLDSDFFSTKEGRKLVNIVVGDKYKMSEDTLRILEQNDDIIDRSLGMAGVRGYERASDYIRKAVEDNPNLSQREKFRIESLIRLNLGMQALEKQIEILNTPQVTVKTEKQPSPSPLVGDTVIVQQRINIEQDGTNNLDTLNKMIDSILTQIEFLRDDASGASKLEKFQKDLGNLELERETLLRDAVEPEFEEGDYKRLAELAETIKSPSSTSKISADVTTTVNSETLVKLLELEDKTDQELESFFEKFSESRNADVRTLSRLIENVLEQRERKLILESPLENVATIIDEILKKDSYFLEKKEGREAKQVAEKYQKEVSEEEAVVDFKDAYFGNVTTWVADALKMREAARVFIENGKSFKDLLRKVQKEFEGEGLTEQEAENIVTAKFESYLKKDFRQQQVADTYSESKKKEDNTELVKAVDELVTPSQTIKSPDNAVKKSQEQIKESNADSSISEYQRADEGQQENWESQREQGQTTESETNYSDSPLSSPSKEELLNLQLATNYPKLLEVLINTGVNPIEEIDSKIEELENKIAQLKSRFRIIESEDWQRLNELYTKREVSDLSDNERIELVDLEDEINSWLLATGTIADGLRLSDLLRQKVALENVSVTPVQEVTIPNPQEILGGVDLGDRKGSANYLNGQTYDAVTVIRDDKTGLIAISGIKPEALFEEVGFPFEFALNERNNILISDEVRDRINRESSIGILPTNADLTTAYSVVIKGQSYLRSNYSEDFEQTMVPDRLYDIDSSSNIILEVDPNDSYNRELLDRYRELTQSTGTLDEDALSELEDTIYTDLLSKDSGIKILENRAANIKSQIKDETTIDKKAALQKDLLKVNKQITKREDTLYAQAQKEASKRSQRTATPEEVQEVTDQIRRSAVIRIKDSEGNFLAVAKAASDSTMKTQDDMRFEAMRDAVFADTDFIDRLANINTPAELNFKPGVSKIYLGHPNFLFLKNEDGSYAIEYRKVNSQTAQKIIDLGYVDSGKITTRSGTKGLDTTFLEKFIRQQGQNKIPFVVLQKGKYRVAYPVRIEERERPDHSEFERIFNSSATITNKVVALNKYLANYGIDPKVSGFYSTGATNLTQEFFQAKLAELNSLPYFYSLDEWVSKGGRDIAEIAQEQIYLNIDLSNPFHSPKLRMNLDNIEIPVEAIQTKKGSKKTIGQSILSSVKAMDTDIEAQDQLDTEC